jgi:RNA-splicing ligase RtcB
MPGARTTTGAICGSFARARDACIPGQCGFVGGSMGDDAVISEGIDSSEAKASLYSTVHGAGRLFGRKEAKHRFSAPKWIPGCKRAA